MKPLTMRCKKLRNASRRWPSLIFLTVRGASTPQRVSSLNAKPDGFTYLVRDAQGNTLLHRGGPFGISSEPDTGFYEHCYASPARRHRSRRYRVHAACRAAGTSPRSSLGDGGRVASARALSDTGQPVRDLAIRAFQPAHRTALSPSHRGTRGAQGFGLGLGIVSTIAMGVGAKLTLALPATGRHDGFEASVQFAATYRRAWSMRGRAR